MNCLEQKFTLDHSFSRTVYQTSELTGALMAIDQTASNILSHMDSPEARAYAAGHRAALEAVAQAFSLRIDFKNKVGVQR